MHFDRMALIADNIFGRESSLFKLLSEARLFAFEGNAHDLPSEYSEEEIAWLRENFRLPFPVVVVEDRASAVLVKEPGEETSGLVGVKWDFVECISMDAPPDAFFDTQKLPDDYIDPNLSLIVKGWIRFPTVESRSFTVEGSVDNFLLCDKKSVVLTAEQAIKQRLPLKQFQQAEIKNASSALQELMYINSPNRFILEARPARTRKPPFKKIPREHERSTYTILEPKRIREVMNLPEPTAADGIKRRPHERRAHPRTFRSERYKSMKNKTIMIPATWIGPSESKVGRKTYRVLLDK